jgi:hypothetical protein
VAAQRRYQHQRPLFSKCGNCYTHQKVFLIEPIA